jgi:hypothetical protein
LRGGDGDAVEVDGVAMATTVLPIARVVMAWRGDDVATKFELAMAMASSATVSVRAVVAE